MKRLLFGAVLFCTGLVYGCASSTMLTTVPEGAKVYVNDAYVGVSPVAYSDSQTIFATNTARFELDGYHGRSTQFTRDGPVNVGAAVGAVLATIPLLWVRDYHPEYRFELRRLDELRAFREAAASVGLGDAEKRVLERLAPTQAGFDPRSRRAPDRYMRSDGVAVTVHYLRSNVQPDGRIGRSDYTPYVFEDGVLVSIGWDGVASSGPGTTEE